jgi:hypothetical protein
MAALVAHGLDEVQAAPWLQAVQAPPALQTPLPPPDGTHEEPARTNVWSLQTGAPVEQSTVALAAQGLDEVQAAPWVQAVHTPPALQTPLPPPEVVQAEPTALNVRSVQTGAPLEQFTVALAAHGFVEVQAVPAAQAVQVPASQTPLIVPDVQDRPFARNVRSVQTAAPLEHSMVALAAHTLLEVQGAFCVQAAQVPLGLQTPTVVPDVHPKPGGSNV